MPTIWCLAMRSLSTGQIMYKLFTAILLQHSAGRRCQSSLLLARYRAQAKVQKLCPDTLIVKISDRESDMYYLFDLREMNPSVQSFYCIIAPLNNLLNTFSAVSCYKDKKALDYRLYHVYFYLSRTFRLKEGNSYRA